MANTKVTGDLIASGTITAANLVSGTLDALLNSYLTTNTYATQGYVTTAVNNLIAAAPASLDTLNELAAALNDDANFATTVTNALATKLNLSGGILTGTLYAGGLVRLTGTTSSNSQLDLPVDWGALRWYDGTTFKGGIGTAGWSGVGSGNDLTVYLNNGNFHVSNNTSPFVTFDRANERVGIGTTSPSFKLSVNTNGDIYSADFYQANSGTDKYNAIRVRGAMTSAVGYYGIGGSTASNPSFRDAFVVGTQSAHSLNLATSDTARMTITSGGNVGIGNTSPSAKLHVNGGTGENTTKVIIGGNDAILRLGDNQGGGPHGFQFDGEGANDGMSIYYRTTPQQICFEDSTGTGGSKVMVVGRNGNVGIGTTTPATLLTTVGSAYSVSNSGRSVGGILVYADSGGVGGYGGAISFGTGGLGSSAIAAVSGPGSDRDVNGLAFFTHGSSSGLADSSEAMRIQYDGSVGIGTNSPGATLQIGNGTSSSYQVIDSSSGGAVQFKKSGTAAAFVGEVAQGLGSGNGLLLYTYSGVDRPIRFYPGGTEKMRILSSGGITFNGDTAAANALDDYEEGNWTPNISSGGTWGTAGTYIKIGTLVMVTFRANPTGTQTITANSTNITNLPFTIDSGLGGAGYVGSWTDVSASSGIYGIHTTSSTTAYFTGTLTTGGVIAGTLVYRST